MESDLPSSSARHRFISSIAVAAITSVVLMIFLDALSYLGAKDFIEGITKETVSALSKLNPLDLGQQYLTLFADRISPCHGLSFSASRACFAESGNRAGGLGTVLWDLISALFALLGQLFSESATRAFVDIMQLIAGFAAAFTLMIRFNLLQAYAPVLLGIPLGIAFTCLLSIPMLGIMYFVSMVLGDVLPAQASLSVFGGSWLGFVFACSGRSVEGGLHHIIGTAVERAFGKR